jgi:hypothetical protein
MTGQNTGHDGTWKALCEEQNAAIVVSARTIWHHPDRLAQPHDATRKQSCILSFPMLRPVI